MKLRTSYEGLTIELVEGAGRRRLLDYAGVPERFEDHHFCLALPDEDEGFVVCGRATVVSGKQVREHSGWRWPENGTVLHSWTTAASE
ncbi:hypothetical protein JIG36_51290 [Actinoplanes sp. LDG1-06]|uniref:Uncharacterized protein n=1 Tax=Paractinoplanes ovalisporus TaxID=2810368 RepID=A0ABS2AWX5_9ACTN|nr:hypothetical protein [Actinoplanes ovalisporus]MBM2623903.1 hypothetical protein [Actinoplanes ovalisporus]